jgi:hypothetical protein
MLPPPFNKFRAVSEVELPKVGSASQVGFIYFPILLDDNPRIQMDNPAGIPFYFPPLIDSTIRQAHGAERSRSTSSLQVGGGKGEGDYVNLFNSFAIVLIKNVAPQFCLL